MNRDDLIKSVRRSWTFAQRLQIGETFSNPAPLSPTDEFRQIAADETTLYEDVYLHALRNVFYNFSLTDFSYFQFGVNEDGETRFAYYPNPFIGASQGAMMELAEMREYVSEELITHEEYLHAVSELRTARHPPLIRYENAPSQYVEFKHPCSHFHFGNHADNRWPASRILTPTAFSLLIYKQFYGAQWSAHGAPSPPEVPSLDTCLIDARQDSRILADALFSEGEARQFHFS